MMLQKMMILGSIAKMKLRDLFTDEKGEVNIVAIVILIGIAVILALIFKDQGHRNDSCKFDSPMHIC